MSHSDVITSKKKFWIRGKGRKGKRGNQPNNFLYETFSKQITIFVKFSQQIKQGSRKSKTIEVISYLLKNLNAICRNERFFETEVGEAEEVREHGIVIPNYESVFTKKFTPNEFFKN